MEDHLMEDRHAMPHGQPILIVDGDTAMRETLREQLIRDDAFTVVEAASAREAEACLHAQETRREGRFAAIIMDAALPDGDGHAVCARLRARGHAMPVILLNGRDRGGGADDTTSLAKPFRLSELMACLRARLDASAARDAARDAAPRLMIGPYAFNADERSLRLGASPRIRLTEKEAAILAFLHRMGERAVPRQELLREVWGYNPAVTTHTLETHIYRLRRKIEANPAEARLLITEAGGYRLASGSLTPA